MNGYNGRSLPRAGPDPPGPGVNADGIGRCGRVDRGRLTLFNGGRLALFDRGQHRSMAVVDVLIYGTFRYRRTASGNDVPTR